MAPQHADLLWRDDAVDRVLDRRAAVLARLDTQNTRIENCAGRHVAEAISAPVDVPAHDFATMDGFAVDATEPYPLEIVPEQEVFPEDAPRRLEAGHAVRIATGAPLPAGTNAVLKREEAQIEDGQLWGESLDPGTYVRQQGTSVRKGETLFAAHERLSPKDTLLLGDIGYDTVPVLDPFSVGVVATGTEFKEGRATDLDSPMLMGLIRSWAGEATYEGAVEDTYEAVREAIQQRSREYDVVVTTGGTSVGHKDYVIKALAELGEVAFHRVRIRPGKPIALATLPEDGTVVFAIPGKPIGAHTISTLVMRPFFTGRTALPTVQAELLRDLDIGAEGFEYVVPITMEGDEQPQVMPLGHLDSSLPVYETMFDPSVISSHTRTSRADGVFITTERCEAGEMVDVIPYPVIE